ncbi:protein aurora borealis isoform X1 [Anastrepha obliqua]|uniref:protein aurora borealis isoform X1 n=1 Tax=Anastrepha obliqua TaxID=95512 RepID=UPI00240A95BF|nr:protein aurora borealis isoform X1 [Anastrepha obliqua]
MEYEKAGTPLKLYSTMQMSGKVVHKVNNEIMEITTTPGGGRCQKKLLHPRTPSKSINCSMSTTNSSAASSSSKYMSCSTPPAKRLHRIRNPFEPGLAERLHLPLIGSPSLFQRPTTPQLSSTQFEWNIDEVSSLKPANVEPHETQFHDSPDPDYEAKAQSAISSYFKEHQIVPSPVDCPLRSHRIVLSELNINTPITKSGLRIRDCGTQTELSLPMILPPELEEALMPYFQPHLAVADRYTCDIDSHIRFSSDSNMSIMNDAKDMSLRRKLFDMNNIVVLDEGTSETKSKTNHSNSSPSTCGSLRGGQFAIVGKLSDSLEKSSFGSLSPISASDGFSNSPQSPHEHPSEMKSHIHTFMQELADAEQLSPIHPPVRQTSRRCREEPQQKNKLPQSAKDSYRCNALNQSEATTIDDHSLAYMDGHNEGEKFTPDRSSSPLRSIYKTADLKAANGQQSIDSSFNMKVSRLAVNSSKCMKHTQQRNVKAQEYDMFAHDDTQDLIEDDDMQVSQLSAQNFNCSSSSSTDTPRSKRRSASRKNLSQSFSLNWLDDEDLEEDERQQHAKASKLKLPIDVPRIDITVVDELIGKEHELQQQQQQLQEQLQKETPCVLEKCGNDDKCPDTAGETTRALFYRTDSGFNEMPTSGSCSTYSMGANQQCDSALSPTKQLDVSMVCCSTPSKCAATASVVS